jgi:adenylylsulfate kinase-like enzyme
MSILIILRGPAGVGKSTIASMLKEKIEKSVHLDIDSFKRIVAPETSDERTEIAHAVGRAFITELIKKNYNVIIDELFQTTNYDNIKALIQNLNCDTLSVFLHAPLNELIKRDQERLSKTKGAEKMTKYFNEIHYIDEDLNIDAFENSPENIINEILKNIPQKYILKNK